MFGDGHDLIKVRQKLAGLGLKFIVGDLFPFPLKLTQIAVVWTMRVTKAQLVDSFDVVLDDEGLAVRDGVVAVSQHLERLRTPHPPGPAAWTRA
jgi:hypothetical protein